MLWATLSIWVAWAGSPTIGAIGLVAFLYGDKRHKVDMILIFVWMVLGVNSDLSEIHVIVPG